MTYKYALLRSTDTGMVVDFNEKEMPVQSSEAIRAWQSSHVTIPVDKGQEESFIDVAISDLRGSGKNNTTLNSHLKQGIALNPEVLEVRPNYSPLSNQANAFEATKYLVFLREEKKLTYTEGGIKGENGVINVITRDGVRYIREGYQEQPAELPTDAEIYENSIDNIYTEHHEEPWCNGAIWMRDYIQSNYTLIKKR